MFCRGTRVRRVPDMASSRHNTPLGAKPLMPFHAGKRIFWHSIGQQAWVVGRLAEGACGLLAPPTPIFVNFSATHQSQTTLHLSIYFGEISGCDHGSVSNLIPACSTSPLVDALRTKQSHMYATAKFSHERVCLSSIAAPLLCTTL